MKLGEPLKVVSVLNEKLSPEIKTVDIELGQIEKGGYPHFMLKEIFEQPSCLTNCMRGRVNIEPVSYTHLTLPTTCTRCRSRWSPYH